MPVRGRVVGALLLAVVAAGAPLATPALATPAQAPAAPGQHGSHLVTLVLGSTKGPAGMAEITDLARTRLSTDAVTRRHQVAQRLATLGTLAPGQDAFARVAGFAAEHHLDVVSRTDWTVTVAGSPAALAPLFGVHTKTVSFRRGVGKGPSVSGLAPSASLTVPAELAGVATLAAGLDDRPVYRPRLQVARGATASPAAIPAESGGHTGSQYTAHYGGLPYASLSNNPQDGHGVGVGVLSYDPGGIDRADYQTYLQAGNIHALMPIDAGASKTSPFGDTSTEDAEGNLDIDALASVAPEAQALIYEPADNSVASDIAMYAKLADDAAVGKIQVVSSSFGYCEPGNDSSDINGDSQQLARLLAAGATFFGASGDDGAYDCAETPADKTALEVDYPASDPSAVAVGGVNENDAGGDSAWGDPSENQNAPKGAGGGGGVSTLFTRPSWQQGVAGVIGTTRNVPDVAGPADPRNGFTMYLDSAWHVYGGTSLATPLTAGWTADVLSLNNHDGITAAPGFGDIHQVLYAHPQDFTDITTGNNLYYLAGAGYDQTTGLGTLNLPAWTNLLLGAPFSDPRLMAPATTTTATISISSSSSMDRHFSGFRVTVGADSCQNGVPASGGTIPSTVTLPALGKNTLTLVSEDELGTCHATSVVVAYVTPVAPAILSAASSTLTAGAPSAFTVTSTGSPTPAISQTGLPSGVTLIDHGDGTASLSGTATAAGTFPVTLMAANGVNPAASQSFVLTVIPAALNQLEVVTGPAGRAGSPIAVTVTGFDGFGNSLGAQPGAALTISPDGTCTPTGCTPVTGGTHTVTAAEPTGSGGTASASTTVTPGYSAPAIDRAVLSVGDAEATVTYGVSADGASPVQLTVVATAKGHPPQTQEVTVAAMSNGSAVSGTIRLRHLTDRVRYTFALTVSTSGGTSTRALGSQTPDRAPTLRLRLSHTRQSAGNSVLVTGVMLDGRVALANRLVVVTEKSGRIVHLLRVRTDRHGQFHLNRRVAATTTYSASTVTRPVGHTVISRSSTVKDTV